MNLAGGPPRVNPRTIPDLALGYTRRRDSVRKWEAVLQASNRFDSTALYNCQSIFVGTRLISPRAVSLRLLWFFQPSPMKMVIFMVCCSWQRPCGTLSKITPETRSLRSRPARLGGADDQLAVRIFINLGGPNGVMWTL